MLFGYPGTQAHLSYQYPRDDVIVEAAVRILFRHLFRYCYNTGL
jgi:hypothetical protein